jgi:hypothetical protein
MTPLIRVIKFSICLLIVSFGLQAFVQAAQLPGNASIEDDLKAFHSNPKEFLNRIPQKTTIAPTIAPELASDRLFDDQEIQSNSFVKSKAKWRKSFIRGERPALAPNALGQKSTEPQSNDLPENLVDNGAAIKQLGEMETQSLKNATLPVQPFSGDYWAMYKGILGARNFDARFPQGRDWSLKYNYILDNSFFSIFLTNNISSINLLSPAEKYDLLVGDRAGTFTQVQWKKGQYFWQRYKSIETWMGICEGWAASAFMMPRPQHSVITTAFDGRTPLKFNPSELKGLAAYQWASARYPYKFIGGRCNISNPRTDINGRIIDKNCLDTNPATWHVSVVNQIGASHRSFIMDATYDYQVWNEPIYSYNYTYFNPVTLVSTDSLEAATILREAYTNDKFKNYRSSRATSFVGVAMDVTYVSLVGNSTRDVDAPSYDQLIRVRYLYDLELDASGNIIGGEWYTNRHPDFLWVPGRDSRAMAAADAGLNIQEWNGSSALPARWQERARTASQSGQILGSIVEVLFNQSQKK